MINIFDYIFLTSYVFGCQIKRYHKKIVCIWKKRKKKWSCNFSYHFKKYALVVITVYVEIFGVYDEILAKHAPKMRPTAITHIDTILITSWIAHNIELIILSFGQKKSPMRVE